MGYNINTELDLHSIYNYLAFEPNNDTDKTDRVWAFTEDNSKFYSGVYKKSNDNLTKVNSLLRFSFDIDNNLDNNKINLYIENNPEELDKYPNLIERYESPVIIKPESSDFTWYIDTKQSYIIKQFIA